MTILYLMNSASNDLAAALMAESALPGVVADPAEFAVMPLDEIEGAVISTALYSAEIAARLAAKAPKLRWIQSLSTGVDYYQEKGIPKGVTLTSASGAHAPNVADHALSLVLSLCRGSAAFAVAQAQKTWVAWADLPEQRSLSGMQTLVLGNGPSGVATAKRLLGFEASVTLVGRRQKEEVPGVEFRPVSQLDALLPQAQLVVMVLPSTPETIGIMSAKRLALLPKGALLVNVGRGDALDEPALVQLLTSGHLGGAGLDVMAVEPLPAESPLWTVPNLILTPHVAGRSDASRRLILDLVRENLRRFAAGEELLNIVEVG